jgi:hypothetical protein
MNRRGFFSTLLPATAVFSILPSALTYERIWKPTKSIYETATLESSFICHPDMPFMVRDFYGQWRFVKGDIGPLFVPQ